MKTKFSEYNLQCTMIHHFRPNNILVPNIEGRWGEMDILKLTRAGYATEYEIKISRADFNKDRKKDIKHGRYKNAYEKINPNFTFDYLKGVPNYFVYVVPSQLNIIAADVPDYAGLSIITEHGYLEAIKPEPKIHKQNFRKYWIEKIAYSLCAKYLDHYFLNMNIRRRIKDVENKNRMD